MPQFGWTTCPATVRRQTMSLVEGLFQALGDELLGVYLHGSLAMGCFNPWRSDVDVLAVAAHSLAPAVRPRLARLLLRLSGVPNAIEISVLSRPALLPWRHPAPYEFHYSEDWRDRTQAHLDHNTWPEATDAPTDSDLAALIATTLKRGVGLWGLAAAEVLPPVPPADYLDSILADFYWGRDLLGVNPVYFVLNACRVRAYLQDGPILSKDEGGEWGLRHLPAAYAAVIRQALLLYRGELTTETWSASALEAFAAEMAGALPQHSAT
jgi:streptomycin 3"-adenylyltransferase